MFAKPEYNEKMNTAADDDIVANIVARLREFDLQVDAVTPGPDDDADVVVVLSHGRSRQEFAMMVSRRVRLSDLSRSVREQALDERPVIVAAAQVSPRSADVFRRMGLNYVDAAGNASIRFGDVLIDVRGRRPALNVFESRHEGGKNLFSTARAQVAFALLQWPSTWGMPQRALAEAAGVSLGQAHDALAMFREAGFGPTGGRSSAELLDLWAAAYPAGLGRKLVLARYRGVVKDFERLAVDDPGRLGGAVVSGEVAAHELLRPASLTIYVADLDPTMSITFRWRSDGAGNIAVKRAFWTTPVDEAGSQRRQLRTMPQAPDLLVYADLLASDDPRVRGAAADWRSRARPDLDR